MNKPAPRIETILAQAVDIATPKERQAFVEQACSGDAALQGRLERLISYHFKAGNFLERPPVACGSEAAGSAYGPGTVIGPYRLLEQLGEGGMGLVYVAEQQRPLRRRVALKIIKPGMDSRQVIARFEAERQALAMMEHASIAKVYDAGTTPQGGPYFVMELVKGTTITEYCDTHRLTNRQRLQLFLDVCQAVQHAHQKGIIHRDLKPSNILVSHQDAHAVVKVIDFGVAKATGPRLADRTCYTGFAQLIGTPLYMSPEQAGLSDLDVDSRSDVYALGVLLYELLTGTTPFDSESLKRVGYDEMRRIIREGEPPRPSTRLSTIQPSALATIAERRGLEPRRLRQDLRGELDWIAMRALEKDRNRRYDSAGAFAADVQRYLNNEPVVACPPTAGYRLCKFARRNRGVLAAAGVVVLALIAATAVSSWQAMRARAALKQAEAKSRWARRAVDEMYTQVAEKWLADTPHMSEVQRQFLVQALEFYKELSQEQSTDPDVRLETGKAYRRLGRLQHGLLHADAAEQPFRDSVAVLERLVADVPDALAYRLQLARSYGALGQYLKASGHRGEAEAWLARACSQCASLGKTCPDDPAIQNEYATNLRNVGDLFRITQRPQEAERVLRETIARRRRLVARFPERAEYRQDLAASYRPLAELLYEARQLGAAERSLREIVQLLEPLVAQSPTAVWPPDFLAGSSILLGMVLWESGRPAEAAKALERAIQLRLQVSRDFPARDVETALVTAYASYGALLASQGRFEHAEHALQQALEFEQKAMRKQPTRLPLGHEAALVYGQLARLYVAAPSGGKNLRQAQDCIQKALKLKPNDTAHLTTLGAVYCRLGQWDEARAAFRKVVEIDGNRTGSLRDWTSDNTPLTRLAQLHCKQAGVLRWFYLALCHQQQGERTKGLACYQQALMCWQAQRQELAPWAKELEGLQAETAAALHARKP